MKPRALIVAMVLLVTGGTPAMADVACVQRELTKLGLDPGPVDGQLGRKTLRAARSFQKGAAHLPDLSVDMSSTWCDFLKKHPPLDSPPEANVGVMTDPTMAVTPILGRTPEYQVPAWVKPR